MSIPLWSPAGIDTIGYLGYRGAINVPVMQSRLAHDFEEVGRREGINVALGELCGLLAKTEGEAGLWCGRHYLRL